MSDQFWAVLATFAASLIPGLELRAGIPLGLALGLPVGLATAVAIAGSLVQIQMALAAVAWAYRHAGRIPAVGRWLRRTEAQVRRHEPLIRRWGWLGLAGFVMLPFPGTGVWGGVVLARLLLLPSEGVWLGVSLGVLGTGLLWGLGTAGIFGLLRLFF